LPKRTDEGTSDSEDSDGLYRNEPLDRTTTLGEPTSTDSGCATTHVDVLPEHPKDSTFPKQAPESQATNKKSGFLTVALLILLLCAIGGGVYFFLKFREGQSEISRLKENFGDNQKSKFESEISRLKTELEEAKKHDLPTATDEQEKLRKVVESKNSEINDLKDSLQTATSDKQAVDVEVGRLKSQKGNLQKDLESERATLAETQKDLKGKNLKIKSLEEQVEHLTSIQGQLDTEILDLKKKEKEMPNELSKIKMKQAEQIRKKPEELDEKEKNELMVESELMAELMALKD